MVAGAVGRVRGSAGEAQAVTGENDLVLRSVPIGGTGYDNHLCSPPVLYAAASQVFGPFDLDVCASDRNHLAPEFFSEARSCLREPWGPVWSGERLFVLRARAALAWCNPPYSEDYIGDIVMTALAEALAGRASTLMIFPAKKSQFPWWAAGVVGVDGPGATGIITASGPGQRGRIDFHRGGVPLGCPNHASVLVWFQAGLVSRNARWHYRLPWAGTLCLPAYEFHLPGWAMVLLKGVR